MLDLNRLKALHAVSVRLRERLVEMHRPLAMEIARRYRYRGEPLENLLQAALLLRGADARCAG